MFNDEKNQNNNQEFYNIDENQTEMFDQNGRTEEATEIHIEHLDEKLNEDNIGDNMNSEHDSEEEIPRFTKFKVLAAIGILAVAGYLAYWVQEPVDIKADLLAQAETEMLDEEMSSEAEVEGEIVDVDLSLFGFQPGVLTIEPGTTVRWTNTSSETQTIIGDGTDETSFSSPSLESGDEFSYTFDNEATFEYYSTYNPARKAQIIVGSGEVEETAPENEINDEAEAASVLEETVEENNDVTPEELFGSAEETIEQTEEESPADNVNTAPDTVNEIIQAIEQTEPNVIAESEMTETTNIEEEQENENFSEEELATAVLEESTTATHASAKEEITKTGPAEMMYLLGFGAILYFNRRKLGLTK
ncbi:hypothetical protein GF376_04815 [Candidatus Peregrinibacteria bacterium]|nr:hypothetical protein [Candidatus Peregrinibacteria bacterium]